MHPPKYSSHIPRETPQHPGLSHLGLPIRIPFIPGYSKTAAIDAIRRHAFNFIVKDLTEEVEGPVTKSIRLTSCLILRNIARYSVEGRWLVIYREGRSTHFSLITVISVDMSVVSHGWLFPDWNQMELLLNYQLNFHEKMNKKKMIHHHLLLQFLLLIHRYIFLPFFILLVHFFLLFLLDLLIYSH